MSPLGRGRDCDVVVLGAGLTGAAAARSLAVRGRHVVVLEQFAVGHDLGSSHGTSRIFRRAYADPFYVDLTGRAGHAWDALEAEAGERLRTFTGGLDAGGRREPAALVELLAARGIVAELLRSEDVAERWPGMALDGPTMFHPDAGFLDSDATVAALVRLARAAGAEIRQRTAVERVEPAPGGVVVHAASGAVRAGVVVVAAGAWLPELGLEAAGVRLPTLRVKQQEVFHFPFHDPSVAWPTLVYKDEVALYGLASGADGGARPAMKVAQFDSESTTTASGRDGVIDPRARDVVTGFVRRALPGLEPEPAAEQSCLFTMTPTEDFVLDRVGQVVVASPCSGHGAKFAPLIGDLIADLVAGAPADPRFALSR